MSKDSCKLRGNNPYHCWHNIGGQLVSNPPQQHQRCCYCGETRRIRLGGGEISSDHGPYYPKTKFKDIRE